MAQFRTVIRFHYTKQVMDMKKIKYNIYIYIYIYIKVYIYFYLFEYFLQSRFIQKVQLMELNLSIQKLLYSPQALWNITLSSTKHTSTKNDRHKKLP